MAFRVLDNGKHADAQTFFPSYPSIKNEGWDNSLFDTFDEALIYARKWIGIANGGSDDGQSGIRLKLGIPYQYSNYEDWIEIKEVI